jgi:hypothetical protein
MKIYSDSDLGKVKGKVFPTDAMMAYRGSGGIIPLVHTLGIRWRRVRSDFKYKGRLS